MNGVNNKPFLHIDTKIIESLVKMDLWRVDFDNASMSADCPIFFSLIACKSVSFEVVKWTFPDRSSCHNNAWVNISFKLPLRFITATWRNPNKCWRLWMIGQKRELNQGLRQRLRERHLKTDTTWRLLHYSWSFGTESTNQLSKNKLDMNGVDLWTENWKFIVG